MTKALPPIELWPISSNSGWGTFGFGLAMALARHGQTVVLPPMDVSGFAAPVRPLLLEMMAPRDQREHRIALLPYGLHWPKHHDMPNRTQVLIYMAEDSAVPDHAIEEIKKYDLVLAPSAWAQGILAGRGVDSQLFHQGFDESIFVTAPRKRPAGGPLYIFSGGKLEFRKGQDIVVEAFRKFRETELGKDAVLVTAWQNLWPQTMVSIWESGYVKGMPVMRDGRQDISTWLEANGIPKSASIDLGMLPQTAMAEAIRECDFAIFPNRCECATNLVLPETMACGVPCIVGNWAGQADVVENGNVLALNAKTPVTLPCPIFNGYDGWGEADIGECVQAMTRMASNPDAYWRPEYEAKTFSWTNRARHLLGILKTLA